MEGNTTSAIPIPASPNPSAIPSIPPPPARSDGQSTPSEEQKSAKQIQGEENSSTPLSMIGDILKEEEEMPASVSDTIKEVSQVQRQESSTFIDNTTPPASNYSKPLSPSPDFRTQQFVKPAEQVNLMNVKQTQKPGQQQVFTEEDPFGNAQSQQSNEPQKKDARQIAHLNKMMFEMKLTQDEEESNTPSAGQQFPISDSPNYYQRATPPALGFSVGNYRLPPTRQQPASQNSYPSMTVSPSSTMSVAQHNYAQNMQMQQAGTPQMQQHSTSPEMRPQYQHHYRPPTQYRPNHMMRPPMGRGQYRPVRYMMPQQQPQHYHPVAHSQQTAQTAHYYGPQPQQAQSSMKMQPYYQYQQQQQYMPNAGGWRPRPYPAPVDATQPHNPSTGGTQDMYGQSHYIMELRQKLNEEGSRVSLDDLEGHLCEVARDQDGSRILQDLIEKSDEASIERIINEIVDESVSIAQHKFGNYVIQKLLERSSSSQKQQLADQLLGSIAFFSKNLYGCRVVQKALQLVDEAQLKIFLGEIREMLQDLIEDHNGNHVIQLCLLILPIDAIDFILYNIEENLIHYCQHQYGCRVVQSFFKRDFPRSEQIITKMTSELLVLARNQFGNYVIQNLLEYCKEQVHGVDRVKDGTFNAVIKNLVSLSKHSFGSHVIEKVLKEGDEPQRKEVVEAVIGSTRYQEYDLKSTLYDISCDKFGNYVVQKVLEYADQEQRIFIVSHLDAVSDRIRHQQNYSRHVYSFIENGFKNVPQPKSQSSKSVRQDANSSQIYMQNYSYQQYNVTQQHYQSQQHASQHYYQQRPPFYPPKQRAQRYHPSAGQYYQQQPRGAPRGHFGYSYSDRGATYPYS